MRAGQAALGKLSRFTQPYFYGWDLRFVLGLQNKSLILKLAVQSLASASFLLLGHRVWVVVRVPLRWLLSRLCCTWKPRSGSHRGLGSRWMLLDPRHQFWP